MTRRGSILATSFLAIGFAGGRSTSAQCTGGRSNRRDFLALAQEVIMTAPDVGLQVACMDAAIPIGQAIDPGTREGWAVLTNSAALADPAYETLLAPGRQGRGVPK